MKQMLFFVLVMGLNGFHLAVGFLMHELVHRVALYRVPAPSLRTLNIWLCLSAVSTDHYFSSMTCPQGAAVSNENNL